MATQSPVWQKLAEYQQVTSQLHIRDLFAADANCFDAMHKMLHGLLFNYSKNRIAEETLTLLCNLADNAQVKQRMQAMRRDDKISTNENRASLHIVLRLPEDADPIMVGGENIVPKMHTELNRALSFAGSITDGSHTGITGKRITGLVHIDTGGSDLGPQMGAQALYFYRTDVCVHFVSSSGDTDIAQTSTALDPETTIFSIASRSFGTPETLLSGQAARDWYLQHGLPEGGISHHFCAVPSNVGAAIKFGIPPEHVFGMLDWVDGRYSIWSTIGFPMMVAVGPEDFREFLRGVHAMDEHFFNTEFRHNIPVLMVLLNVWYNNFCHLDGHTIVPYSHNMRRFTAWLNQLDMESCGKQRAIDGKPVDCITDSIIFGEEGPNCQHTYFQLLHQGTRLIPVDFIVSTITPYGIGRQDRLTVANAFAQTEALMKGKTLKETRAELSALPEAEHEELAPQKEFPGNRPSNSFLFDKLNPFSLGMLMAAYEHRTLVQGVIWNINPFDQQGVEYGKVLAKAIEPELESGTSAHDSSTNGLIALHRQCQK